MSSQKPTTLPVLTLSPNRMFLQSFWKLLVGYILVIGLLWGCSTTHEQATGPIESGKESGTPEKETLSSTDEQIFVGDTIEMSYDPNVIMKRAESYFEKESYAEAIVEYKHFLDLHRNHVLAPYAQYKIGNSHYKQFKTVDRDPDPLNQAISAYTKLLKDFPENRYQAEAKQAIHTCREILAKRHLMVGEFYLKRDAYLAAAHRFEKIINEYADLDTAGEAMYQLAETYQDLGIEEWTQEWLIAFLNQYPQNSHHSKAEKQLASLQKNNPQLLAALPKNHTMKGTHSLSPSKETDHSQPDNPPLTYAGVLATTETVHADTLNLPQTVSRAPQASCQLGNWCESASTVPQPTSPSDSQAVLVCKAGEWC